MKSMGL